MIIKMITLCSITCFSLNIINASGNNEKSIYQELSTAAYYGAFITAAGAVPVTATVALLGNNATASNIALGVMAAPGAFISIKALLNNTERSAPAFKKASYLSLAVATAYGTSKLTNNAITTPTFASSFFTGLGLIVMCSAYTQGMKKHIFSNR